MLQNYSTLNSCLAVFADFFQVSCEEYKKYFEEAILTERLPLEQVKLDLMRAISDKDFSWKEAAKKKSVFFYDEEKTESEIFHEFKLLTWNVLFPLSKEEVEMLESRIRHILLNEKNGKSVEIFELLEELKEYPQWATLDESHIIQLGENEGKAVFQLERYAPDLCFIKLK
jgi:hypothetical protein